MYADWRNLSFRGSMDSGFSARSSKQLPTINVDKLNETNHTKKTKGWGHWNSFLKSDEYAKLVPGNIEITEEELAKHNKPGDLWIGLTYEKRVCVFDISIFAEYHPGGYDIIKSAAGRDATEDFRIAHAYVNPNMISRFKKGFLVRTAFKSPNTLSPGMSMLAPVRKPQPTTKPKWDWSETEGLVVLTFSLHRTITQKLDCVSVHYQGNDVFKLRIFFDDEYYFFGIKLHDYLTPLLDSLECDEHGRSLSINLTSKLGFPVSNLGGVVEDSMLSITDAVDKEEFLPCTLIKTRDLNYDCRELKIEWPKWARIGIPYGHHVLVKAVIGNESIQRPYTPVCEITYSHGKSEFVKEFTLMVKCYKHGQMSSYLHSLDEDALVMISLPVGSLKSFSWFSPELAITKSPYKNEVQSVVFVAAGSGITPMIRLILSCLFIGKLSAHLLFFNKSQRDIIYTSEFEALERFYKDKFQVSYILSEPNPGWTGLKGRISAAICKETITDKFSKRLYMICGPPGFNKLSAEVFRSLKVEDNQIFEFKG